MYTIQDIRNTHDMNYCGTNNFKGINYTSDKNTLVLIHTNTSSYNDSYDGEILYYDGQGLKGDQKMTHANKKLLDENVKCHVYWQNEYGLFDYLGRFKVEDVREDYSTNRRVYKFELHKLIKSRWCVVQ